MEAPEPIFYRADATLSQQARFERACEQRRFFEVAIIAGLVGYLLHKYG